MKVVRTVRSGGKAGDNVKGLPIAIVYGIAVTAMNFFTDPTISTLTSGTPRQTADLEGLSFPRQLGVRFNQDYVDDEHLVGCQVKFEAFTDNTFTESLGDKFKHESKISRIGWAKYVPEGIFPERKGYIRMQIFDRRFGMLKEEMYFRFEKEYYLDAAGRSYMVEPVTGERQVRDGIMYELVRKELVDKETGETRVVYEDGRKTRKGKAIVSDIRTGKQIIQDVDIPVVQSYLTRYAEKPRAVFLNTPPHKLAYAKLILILIKQLSDMNIGQSYLTKESQAPLYKTRFMLEIS